MLIDSRLEIDFSLELLVGPNILNRATSQDLHSALASCLAVWPDLANFATLSDF